MCPSCPLGARARLCACPLVARVSFGRHFRCSHFGGKNTREERIFCRDLASRAQISCAEGQTGDEHIRNTKESATRTTTTQRNRASLSLNIYRTMMRSALNASSPLGNNVLRIQCASSSSSSSFKDESASSSSAKNHHHHHRRFAPERTKGGKKSVIVQPNVASISSSSSSLSNTYLVSAAMVVAGVTGTAVAIASLNRAGSNTKSSGRRTSTTKAHDKRREHFVRKCAPETRRGERKRVENIQRRDEGKLLPKLPRSRSRGRARV